MTKQSLWTCVVVTLMVGLSFLSGAFAAEQPNIVLIMTDDQGYGDLGCHGNDKIRTPRIDELYGESLRLTQFHVSPVCSPTRASLMTGRWNYRTGVVDTFKGRSRMHADEYTLAEALSEAGYATGVFGKWHLGDNYPLRAMDQGFQESLVHQGGGIAQPANVIDNGYFDPLVFVNGQPETRKGYCTDIFGDATVEFIRKNKDKPFFAYVPTNAPHVPLLVDEKYVTPYLEMGLDDFTARVYAMIENIDENVGKIMDVVDELGLKENTIFIFMTDNGGQIPGKNPRFNAGLRASKGSVYQGGIQVPFIVRWPGQFPAGVDNGVVSAHVDLFPTLLAACGVESKGERAIDGVNILPILQGKEKGLADRPLFFQWHRGDAPEAYNSSALRFGDYKLVKDKELYNLKNDPQEKTNLIESPKEAKTVAKLKGMYDEWFASINAERNGFAPPEMYIGAAVENPAILTPQDWNDSNGWYHGKGGTWALYAEQAGDYEVTLHFIDEIEAAEITAGMKGTENVLREKVTVESKSVTFKKPLTLEKGSLKLAVSVGGKYKGKGIRFAEVALVGAPKTWDSTVYHPKAGVAMQASK